MTGHIDIDIDIDEIKNVRTDTVLDDGTNVHIADGTEYIIQNTGDSEVSLSERETSRGIPGLYSEDAYLIPALGWTRIKVDVGMNYYVWSLNRSSRVAVGAITNA